MPELTPTELLAESRLREAEADDIDELLSEGACEIANLDSPANPVAMRLRAKLRQRAEAMAELERKAICLEL